MNPDEVRWEVVKALLDKFPSLRERVKEYLKSWAPVSRARGLSGTSRCAIFSFDS